MTITYHAGRRIQGLADDRSLTTQAVYTSTYGQSTYNKLNGTAQAYIAQKCGVELVSTANDGKKIKIGKWKLAREGTLSGLAYMKVENSSGTVKATSTGVDVSSLILRTSGYAYVTFTLTEAVALYNGDRVYIEYTTADGSGSFLAVGEFYNGSTTIPTGFEFTAYNIADANGSNATGTWTDTGYPTYLIPDAIFDDQPVTDENQITNVQSGSRFEETDTRKIYYGALPSLTLDENFSSDNWTDNDSTYIGVSGGALSWNAKRDGTNDSSSRDLGFVASDKWVLRFKITQGSSIGATQAGNGFFFGISDSDQSVGQNTSQDFVGMAYYYDNQSEYNAMDSDGTALPHLYQGDAGQNITISANNVYYFQIIRNGSSYTVEAFTNSDYSTGSLGKLSGTTTASGLRYLKILNELTNGSIPTSTNPFNGTIDDLKFYNGFTTTTDFEWTEEV